MTTHGARMQDNEDTFGAGASRSLLPSGGRRAMSSPALSTSTGPLQRRPLAVLAHAPLAVPAQCLVCRVSTGHDAGRGLVGRGEARFYLNARPLGAPLTRVRCGRGLVYYPALSMAYAERCTLNFGHVPLAFGFALPKAGEVAASVDGADASEVVALEAAHALESPPAQERRASALYLASCLARVCRSCANPALRPPDHDVLALCDTLLCRPADLAHASFGHAAPRAGAAARAEASSGTPNRPNSGRVWAGGFAPGSWALLATEAVAVPLLALLSSSSASTEHVRGQNGRGGAGGGDAPPPAGMREPLGMRSCFVTHEALVRMLVALCLPHTGLGAACPAPSAHGGEAAAVYAIGLLATVMDEEQAAELWPDVFEAVAQRCARCGVVEASSASAGAGPLLGLLLILLRHPASRAHCLACPTRLLASLESAFSLGPPSGPFLPAQRLHTHRQCLDGPKAVSKAVPRAVSSTLRACSCRSARKVTCM